MQGPIDPANYPLLDIDESGNVIHPPAHPDDINFENFDWENVNNTNLNGAHPNDNGWEDFDWDNVNNISLDGLNDFLANPQNQQTSIPNDNSGTEPVESGGSSTQQHKASRKRATPDEQDDSSAQQANTSPAKQDFKFDFAVPKNIKQASGTSDTQRFDLAQWSNVKFDLNPKVDSKDDQTPSRAPTAARSLKFLGSKTS
jgi:hypothetical protein